MDEKVAAVKVEVPTATTETLGIVKPDGITIIIKDGVLTAVGGGVWEYPTQFNNDLRLFQGLTIIQSNNDLDFLRYKVNKLGYKILDEKLVKDAGIIYTVIKFKKGIRY